MDIVGYCTIKKDATTCKGAEKPEQFLGKDCAVMEFDREGGVLCLNPDGTALAMFDKEDVIRKFECTIMGEYVMPPKLDMIQQMAYMTKLTSRKGGYNNIVRGMVIQYGLMEGVYNDNFLFQKEREETQFRSTLSEKDRKIMDLEEELKKHKDSLYRSRRRGNPRRLRRLLRRLRSKNDPVAKV